MASETESRFETSRWFVYLVTVSLALAFAFSLLTITWNNALESSLRTFSLESQLIRDSVARNARIGHNSVTSLAAFLTANPDVSARQFEIIVSAYLEEHDFLKGVVFCGLDQEGSGLQVDNLSLERQIINDRRPLASCSGLFADYSEEGMTRRMLEGAAVVTVPVPGPGGQKDYWLMKLVGESGPGAQALGLVAILMNSHGMLGDDPENMDLSLTLLNDSATLAGRQLLYQQDRDQPESWTISTLSEETITQFPSYSVKLSVSKLIPWTQLDMEILLNSLLIGLGMIMLIVALERSKQKQEQQLIERNAVIEQQVEDQTRELAVARDKALDASRVKSDFLASMSHEIRTPLNAIIGMAELLDETRLSKEQKKYTDVFRKAGDTLLSLVNDILDLSKIEARQLNLENIEFDLEEVLKESLDIYALKAEEKKIELIYEIDPTLKAQRVGDPARIRQIVLNLISNALKFTQEGEITVRAEPEDGKGDGMVNISVSDTGIGIPASKLQSIFESFSQVDSSTTRRYGGTGLGLAICKSLVEMMSGRIWAESEIRKGSKFIFTANLPVAASFQDQPQAATILGSQASVTVGKETRPQPSGETDSRGPLNVLLVDDNDDNRLLVKAYLKKMPYTIDEATDGQEALNKVRDGHYDVIFMDVQMPLMDGRKATRLIREWEKKEGAGHTPIIALTAHAIQEEIDECLDAGCDSHVSKPVKKATLLEAIARYCA